MFQTKIVGKTRTYVFCSIILKKINRAFYEIMWKNDVEWAGHR